MADAVAAGLIVEGVDPAARDASLAEQVAAARRARTGAEAALEGIGEQIGAEQKALSAAQQRAASARGDVAEAERQLRDVTRRVHALTRDQRLLDVVGDALADLWIGRTALTDSLLQRVASADTDVVHARAAVAAAKRTVEAVGTDGLLPAPQVAEEVARRDPRSPRGSRGPPRSGRARGRCGRSCRH
jgi:hypothetical protein